MYRKYNTMAANSYCPEMAGVNHLPVPTWVCYFNVILYVLHSVQYSLHIPTLPHQLILLTTTM